MTPPCREKAEPPMARRATYAGSVSRPEAVPGPLAVSARTSYRLSGTTLSAGTRVRPNY